MQLKLILDENEYTLNVPDNLVAEAEDFFVRMDRDMDQGWQMGREWVDQLDRLQRCQVVANKLVTALETDNHDLGRLMAGYILARAPDIESIQPDIHGEPLNTRFGFRAGSQTSLQSTAVPQVAGLDRPPSSTDQSALLRAGEQVSEIFRAGKQWRFSVLDLATGQWEATPAIASEEEAKRLRETAVRRRYQELCNRS